MSHFQIAVTGVTSIRLPQWGRCFWQDPNDGILFLAYASGTGEVDYITSADSGNSWSQPANLFPTDDFSVHDNFDVFMDPRGHIHCGFRWNGSGCYQFVGKSGSGWTKSSGIGPVGFAAAGDAGTAKGFQGSITVQERAPLVSDVPTRYPAARIAFKNSSDDVNSYWQAFPFNNIMNGDTIGGPNAGANGGYPVAANDGYQDAHMVMYYNDTLRTIEHYERAGPGWIAGFYSPIRLQTGDIPFGRNMCIASGVLKGNGGFVSTTASSGLTLWGNVITTFEEYHKLENYEQSGVFSWKRSIDTSGILGPVNGTNCDISINDNKQLLLYYQGRDEKGRQTIIRFMGDTARIGAGSLVDTEFRFAPTIYHYPSGFMFVGEAGPNNAGGYGNILFWDRFKAIKHPNSPNPSNPKKGEFLVTEGYLPVYPSGKVLTVWNAHQSPGLRELRQPYYRQDYTQHSGSIFTGVIATTSVTNVAAMFDRTLSTANFGTVLNGSMIKMELDGIRTIDEVHVVGSSFGTTLRDIGQIDVWASIDNSTYALVGVIPSGNALSTNSRNHKLVTNAGADTDSPLDFTTRFNPFVAKYVRLNWTGTWAPQDRRITEIRLWGPANTTYSYDGGTYDHLYTNKVERKPYTERFVYHEGTLPNADWRTYGDFTWSVVGSGDWTKTSSLPSAPRHIRYNGMVESGIWKLFNRTQGNGDGFALRSEAIADTSGLYDPLGPVPAGGIRAGHSGVVEVLVIVPTSELSQGVTGRTIQFDLRTDPHPDDRIQFFTVNSDFPGSGQLRYETSAQIDWTTLSFFIPNGNTTLRWVYTRGSQEEFTALGTAWIDNLYGVDGMPSTNSIYGFIRGENPYATGSIYGYLNTVDTSSINGFVEVPEGNPSGIIYGFVSSPSGSVTGCILGYTEGLFESGSSRIYGFLPFNSGSNSDINGWLWGWNGGSGLNPNGPASIIYGFVSTEQAVATGSILGFLRSTQPSSYIYGYMGSEALVASGGGLVGGGPGGGGSSTSNVVPGTNWTWGYLLAHGADNVIYGYVKLPSGVFESRLGYVSAGADSSSINGYTLSAITPTGIIYGWVNGEHSVNQSSHGYTFGIQAAPTGSILGYLQATTLPNGVIWATTIGSLSGVTATNRCPSHNFPLDPEIPSTIPTNFF
jgi:hypothetical protein